MCAACLLCNNRACFKSEHPPKQGKASRRERPVPQDKQGLEQLKAVAVKKLHKKNMVSKNDSGGSFSAIKYLQSGECVGSKRSDRRYALFSFIIFLLYHLCLLTRRFEPAAFQRITFSAGVLGEAQK